MACIIFILNLHLLPFPLQFLLGETRKKKKKKLLIIFFLTHPVIHFLPSAVVNVPFNRFVSLPRAACFPGLPMRSPLSRPFAWKPCPPSMPPRPLLLWPGNALQRATVPERTSRKPGRSRSAAVMFPRDTLAAAAKGCSRPVRAGMIKMLQGTASMIACRGRPWRSGCCSGLQECPRLPRCNTAVL